MEFLEDNKQRNYRGKISTRSNKSYIRSRMEEKEEDGRREREEDLARGVRSWREP